MWMCEFICLVLCSLLKENIKYSEFMWMLSVLIAGWEYDCSGHTPYTIWHWSGSVATYSLQVMARNFRKNIIMAANWRFLVCTILSFQRSSNIKHIYIHPFPCNRHQGQLPVKHNVAKPVIGEIFGRFLGITGWDPSVCKSILWFSSIKLGYIL
jgi:arabinogalactan endo-1,4-beta-galactosidase